MTVVTIVYVKTIELLILLILTFKFWYKIEEYIQLSRKAIKMPLPFSASYLCEAQFSLYTSTKTTYPIRLHAEVDVSNDATDLQKVHALTAVWKKFLLPYSKAAHPTN